MFLIPAVTVLISLAFAAQLASQYRARGRSHQLVWAIAMLFYAIAAFPEVTGALSGWNPLGYRTYYLFGAVLLVPWLSLGTVELLLPAGRARFAYRAFVGAISLFGLVAIALAPLHLQHVMTDQVPSNCAMWCKSESGYQLANGLSALSAAVGNIVGTAVLVAGAGLSTYRTYRAGLPRNLTLGNILIVAGAVVPAATASLTRVGVYSVFYAGQAVGIAIIFAGFLLIGSVSHARTRAA